MSVGDLADWRGVTEGVPWLGDLPGWDSNLTVWWGRFCFKKKCSLKERTNKFMKFHEVWKKGCFFVLKKHCSLQQIMKFQKGVLFKHNVP